MKVRLGMIGTGRIAARFATDGWQNSNASLAAVYNPRQGSAELFAEKHHIPYAAHDWEPFLSEVDAVYIAAPIGVHGFYIRKSLAAGKHVLCEKPMVVNKKEAEELFRLARENGLILMEAVKTAYCPGFRALLSAVGDGRIGEVRDVTATFTKLVKPGLRELTDMDYGGSLTEVGTYGCYAVLKLLGCDFEKIRFSSQRNEDGLDIFTRVFFEYPEARAAGTARAGLGVKSEGELIIAGTKGYIVVSAPWWMTRHFEVRYEDPDKKDVYEYPFEGNGLQYELGYFLEQIQGRADAGLVTEEESVVLAGIMQRFLAKEIQFRKQRG